MGSIETDQAAVPSAIPVVDLSLWNQSSGSKQEQLDVAKQLISACRNVGFVYIIKHGVPQHMVDAAFKMAQKLFSLSHEEKMQAPHPDSSAHHRGYSSPGLEKVAQIIDRDGNEAQGGPVKECKESYEIGSEQNPDEPNIWLPETTLPGFKQFSTDFYWECFRVAQSIICLLAMGLGLNDPSPLLQPHPGHDCQLRLLHYPPVPASELRDKTSARMPAHSDYSTFTMLFQDDCGGLEVEDPHVAGKYVPATPMPGAMVMNVGDILMRWSNDYLKSTMHRVTLPPLSDRFEGEKQMTRERYSVVFFVSAGDEAMIECLPSCVSEENPARYAPITRREYKRMRASLQY